MSSKFSQEIILAIREGDTNKCLQKLYEKEYRKVKSYISSNSGTLEDAKDIFQEALMVLISYVKLGKYKEENDVGAFLYVVCRNAWKKKASRNRETQELEEYSIPPLLPYENIFNKERKGIIKLLLDELGENCKKILVASIFYDMSLKEICEEYDYANTNAVKTRNYKCKQRLLKRVKKDAVLENYLKESLYV